MIFKFGSAGLAFADIEYTRCRGFHGLPDFIGSDDAKCDK